MDLVQASEWGWAPQAQRWYRFTRFVVYAGVVSVLFFSGRGSLFWVFIIPAALLEVLGELPAVQSRWPWSRFFEPAAWHVVGAGFLWNVFAYHHISIALWILAAVIFVGASAPVWILTTLKCPNCHEPFFRRQPPKWDSIVRYRLTTRTCATCEVEMGGPMGLNGEQGSIHD